MDATNRDELPQSSGRPEGTTCMVCLERTARYYGIWANEGLCRACLMGMEPEIRFKVIRDMHAADRRRWQADNKISEEVAEPQNGSGEPDPA
jgi:hypothetical protein